MLWNSLPLFLWPAGDKHLVVCWVKEMFNYRIYSGIYICIYHCSCSAVIPEGKHWFNPRKTSTGWSISLLISVLLQRLQGRRASKPVPGTRLSILESQNHSPAPNPNNASQTLPSWLAGRSTRLQRQRKQGPRIYDLRHCLASDPAEALLHKIWVPITGMRSLNSSFHLVSRSQHTENFGARPAVSPAGRGCAELSQKNTDSNCGNGWDFIYHPHPSQQGRVKGSKLSPTVCESRARHSSTL